MYGTIARLKVKPGKVETLKNHMSKVTASHQPGFVSATAYRMDADSNEVLLVVAFESKQAYVANANRPETDADFKEMMQFLVAEPEWHDGEIIYSSLAP
jgi:quinol monooxygenase YgiN